MKKVTVCTTHGKAFVRLGRRFTPDAVEIEVRPYTHEEELRLAEADLAGEKGLAARGWREGFMVLTEAEVLALCADPACRPNAEGGVLRVDGAEKAVEKTDKKGAK